MVLCHSGENTESLTEITGAVLFQLVVDFQTNVALFCKENQKIGVYVVFSRIVTSTVRFFSVKAERPAPIT